jgi:ankyrin repeat protein
LIFTAEDAEILIFAAKAQRARRLIERINMGKFKILMLLSLLLIALIACAGCRQKSYAGLTLEEVFSDQNVRQLADAAANGNTDEINTLIAKGVNVNATGEYGITPLWWSLTVYAQTANQRCYDGFAYLLKNGADPNLPVTGLYDNVMYLAAEVNDPRFLEAAINASGEVNQVSARGTPIFGAIMGQNQSNIDLLVAHGANLNVRCGSFEETPLMLAANLQDYANVYYFLMHGADPTLKRESGQTIIWNIEKDNGRISPQSDAYQWMQKVIDLLKQKGIRPQDSDMKNLPPSAQIVKW